MLDTGFWILDAGYSIPNTGKRFRRDNIVGVSYRMQLEGKFILPEVAKKFLPGQGQYLLRAAADRVLANQDEILKYTFLFQIF